MTKECSHCGEDKPFTDFHKGTSKFDLKSKCIICCKLSYDPAKANAARLKHQRSNREDYRRRNSEYDKAHKPQRAAREAYRRAMKLKATPSWLTDEHIKQMESLYIKRDELRLEDGIIYHVDHVVPLISETVCGLHVPWNLQVITASDNLTKGNRV
jgi:hypothetical protein